jgi:hypothetical protein
MEMFRTWDAIKKIRPEPFDSSRGFHNPINFRLLNAARRPRIAGGAQVQA